MPAVVKMLVVVVNLAKVLLKVMNQSIRKHHQNQTVIPIIQMNVYYKNTISTDLSAAVDTLNQNNQNSKPDKYFLHLFREEFLDTVIADTNHIESNLGSSSGFRK